MTVRAQSLASKEGIALLKGQHLAKMQQYVNTLNDVTVWCKIYYSYNTTNQQTTIFTAGHNAMHLQMIESLRQSRSQPCSPSALFVQLLSIWFATVVDCFKATVDSWDDSIDGGVWISCLSPVI